MKRRKRKAFTFVFRVNRVIQVLEYPGALPVGYQMHKGDQLTGVPTAKVIPWEGIEREAFDLLLGNGKVVLDIWYDMVYFA